MTKNFKIENIPKEKILHTCSIHLSKSVLFTTLSVFTFSILRNIELDQSKPSLSFLKLNEVSLMNAVGSIDRDKPFLLLVYTYIHS